MWAIRLTQQLFLVIANNRYKWKEDNFLHDLFDLEYQVTSAIITTSSAAGEPDEEDD